MLHKDAEISCIGWGLHHALCLTHGPSGTSGMDFPQQTLLGKDDIEMCENQLV